MSHLTVSNVSRRYGAVTALARASLAIDAGAAAAIVGPSGSGKTTLLRIIAGFETPDEGTVTLGGDTLAAPGIFVPAHRRAVGVVMQDGALFPHLSVAENIGFGLDPSDPSRPARIAEMMDMVGLDRAMLKRRPDELSGGQQQRVALARALAVKPRLMLLDEPFAALDTELRATTRRAVAALLRAAGITTILVTHDQTEALSFADTVVVLEAGRIRQAGAPRDLYDRPASPFVATFLGDAIVLPARLEDSAALCALGALPIRPDTPHTPHAPATVMIRPEQILLAPDTPDTPGPRGTVMEAEYGGALSSMRIRLSDDGPCFTLRRPAAQLAPPGSRLRLAVDGFAHVFPPDTTPSTQT